MDQTLVLTAQARQATGKQVRHLRAAGQVPAVLYGHKVPPQLLTLTRGELERIFRKAGSSSIVTVKLPQGEQNVLIQDVQPDPTTGLFLHADLYQVRMDEQIKANVPIEFAGTSPAVRELEGTMLTNLAELEVECLPGNLPHAIKVDVASLATFEDVITVADIKVPDGVTVLNEPETNVASVTPPRTQEELEELEEAPEVLDAEGVEEVGKAEGAEGEEGAEEDEAEATGEQADSAKTAAPDDIPAGTGKDQGKSDDRQGGGKDKGKK